MSHTALELIELGAVFFGLGLLGRLAGRIGMSPIPLYLIGGVCFGTGGLVPLGDIGDFTTLAGEVGVVLLLLLLGLEYSAAELTPACAARGRPGVLDIVLNAAPGRRRRAVLGWGPVGATGAGRASPTSRRPGSSRRCWPTSAGWATGRPR